MGDINLMHFSKTPDELYKINEIVGESFESASLNFLSKNTDNTESLSIIYSIIVCI